MAKPTRLSIVSSSGDVEMNEVRAKITGGFEVASSREAVKTILEARRNTNARITQLDLIGHSTDHNYLLIGPSSTGWVVSETAGADYFRDELAEVIADLHIKQVRLLGCFTATPDEQSWHAMKRISTELDGIEVFGTRRVIDEDNYESAGFVTDDALASTELEERPSEVSLKQTTALASRKVAFPFDLNSVMRDRDLPPAPWRRVMLELDAAQPLLEVIEPQAWELPGLLAQPILEIGVRSGSLQDVRVIEVLSSALCVRIRVGTRDGARSLVYGVADPGTFYQLL